MLKILIVEDEKILSDMYSKFFTNHGYAVDVAVDGLEGLNKALLNHPDLILLDIQMPKMDGLTMMHKLRNDSWGKNVKIIILTNFDTNEQQLAAVTKDQPTYYLLKSNNQPDKLLEKVKELLEAPNIAV